MHRALEKLVRARDRAMQAGQTWEKYDDGIGNVLYKNRKTAEVTMEHPIKRAKRLWKEKCAASGVVLDWANDAYNKQLQVCFVGEGGGVTLKADVHVVSRLPASSHALPCRDLSLLWKASLATRSLQSPPPPLPAAHVFFLGRLPLQCDVHCCYWLGW